jgi:hypothetical protein
MPRHPDVPKAIRLIRPPRIIHDHLMPELMTSSFSWYNIAFPESRETAVRTGFFLLTLFFQNC